MVKWFPISFFLSLAFLNNVSENKYLCLYSRDQPGRPLLPVTIAVVVAAAAAVVIVQQEFSWLKIKPGPQYLSSSNYYTNRDHPIIAMAFVALAVGLHD